MTIKEILESKRNGHQSSGKFSISSVNGCWRKKYMELKGLHKSEFDHKALRNFDLGDLFHQQVVKEMFEKCPQHGYNVVAAEINIPENHLNSKYISGRCDLMISNNKTGELIIVDTKSSGDWTLKKVRDGEVPDNYKKQVLLYLHFFNIKRGFLLFFGKHKGEIEEVEVMYNKEEAEKIIKEIEDFFINYVDKDIIPDKCNSEISPFGCEVCSPKNGNK